MSSCHNGVQFFISHLASWLRTRRFSEPTFRPSGATKHWKNTVFRDFPTLFAHLHLLSSDSFSSTLLSSNLSLLSDPFHLCFSSVHIVGSLTSKLPSVIDSILFQITLEKYYLKETPLLRPRCISTRSWVELRQPTRIQHPRTDLRSPETAVFGRDDLHKLIKLDINSPTSLHPVTKKLDCHVNNRDDWLALNWCCYEFKTGNRWHYWESGCPNDVEGWFESLYAVRIYRMRIFARNVVLAKSRFWYFMKRLNKAVGLKSRVKSQPTVWQQCSLYGD